LFAEIEDGDDSSEEECNVCNEEGDARDQIRRVEEWR
jgi:hypothetical protein